MLPELLKCLSSVNVKLDVNSMIISHVRIRYGCDRVMPHRVMRETSTFCSVKAHTT